MKRTALIIAALAISITSAQAEWLGFGKKEPITADDLRSVVEALRPISKGGTTDVALYFWGDGTLHLTVTLPDNTDVRGGGATLKAALDSLMSNMEKTSAQAKSAAEATRAIINTGKPSQ